MTKYQEFLKKVNIINEEKFNEILDSFPEFDIENITFDLYSLDSEDEIASCIIEEILSNWDWAYCEDVNFKNKEFYLEDVKSLEDLEEICDVFEGWTISNYNELREDIKEKEEEEKELNEENSLINYIRTHATLDQLKDFKSQLS